MSELIVSTCGSDGRSTTRTARMLVMLQAAGASLRAAYSSAPIRRRAAVNLTAVWISFELVPYLSRSEVRRALISKFMPELSIVFLVFDVDLVLGTIGLRKQSR